MRPGDEVGGVRIEAVGSTRDGIASASGVDGSGAPREVLWVVDAAAKERFLAAHRQLEGRDGAVARPLAFLDDRAGLVRAPTGDGLLARWLGPVEPGAVAAVGAAVLPVLAGGWPSRRLTAEDLGVDADGRPLLAPRFGRDDRLGDPVKDLAALLVRWWTGRSDVGLPREARPALDPRCDQAVSALRSGALAEAQAALDAMAAPVDLRVLDAKPATLAVRTTRDGGDEEVAGPPAMLLRVAFWGTAAAVWAASLVAAFTVVLLPLSALGAAGGAAIALGGELVVRRTARPALGDRTLGGRTTEAWRALDEVRRALAEAKLPDAPAADVRGLTRDWERDLLELAEGGAGHAQEASARALTARVVREAHLLRQLISRLANDDDDAGSELARWVRTGAP